MMGILKIFKGMDTGGNPIIEFKCDCVNCLKGTSTSPCFNVYQIQDELKRIHEQTLFCNKGGLS